MPTAASLTQRLAESNATEQWVDQVRDTIFNGDADGFERLCAQLDEWPASARRLFVTHARRTDLMHQAVVHGTTTMVQRLAPWSNLRLKDDEGHTALMRAVGVHNLAMVQTLLPASRTSDRDSDGRTALMHALINVRCSTPDDQIVKALWDVDRLSDRTLQARDTLLHLALDSGGAYVPMLLEHLDADLCNRKGVTPLMRASTNLRASLCLPAVRALCDASDPHRTDAFGSTAFLYAVGAHADLLIDALWPISDRHHVQKNGSNALHLAVGSGGVNSKVLVKRLLDDGVDPHHVSLYGITPFQSSLLRGATAVFDTFLTHAPMSTDHPGADLMEFVLAKTLDEAWEPELPFAWNRFARVLQRYDRTALLQHLGMLVRAQGSTAMALLQERLPVVFNLYETEILNETLNNAGSLSSKLPCVPRSRARL